MPRSIVARRRRGRSSSSTANSTDARVEIARRHGAQRPLRRRARPPGRPPAWARGPRRAAGSRSIDADVVLAEGELARLLDELAAERLRRRCRPGCTASPATGYWGQALVAPPPHRPLQATGSASWPRSSSATTLLEHGFDARFLSGEDIDLRWRLRERGREDRRLARRRSSSTASRTRGTFAKGQWLADGHGSRPDDRASTASRAKLLLALPLAAGAARRSCSACCAPQPRWIPYYACFMRLQLRRAVRASWPAGARRRPERRGRVTSRAGAQRPLRVSLERARADRRQGR